MNLETKQEFNSFFTFIRGSLWLGDEKNWGSMAYLAMKFMGPKPITHMSKTQD